MALYHCSVRLCSRGNGRSAAGTCAYILGSKIKDSYTGKVYDYSRREDVSYRDVLLPSAAPVSFLNPQVLMDAANQAERRSDARMGRVIDIALPRELDAELWVKLIREYAQSNFTSNGHVVVAAMHTGEPKPGDKTRTGNNPHAHLLVLTRPLDERGFQPTKCKSRWMNSVDALISWRKSWADLLNRALERYGYLDRRVSHESLASQGIDRAPTIHMGPKASALQRKGIRTKREERYQEIQQRNREQTRQMDRPLPQDRGSERTR